MQGQPTYSNKTVRTKKPLTLRWNLIIWHIALQDVLAWDSRRLDWMTQEWRTKQEFLGASVFFYFVTYGMKAHSEPLPIVHGQHQAVLTSAVQDNLSCRKQCWNILVAMTHFTFSVLHLLITLSTQWSRRKSMHCLILRTAKMSLVIMPHFLPIEFVSIFLIPLLLPTWRV